MLRVAVIISDVLRRRGVETIMDEFFSRVEICCFARPEEIGCDDFSLYIVDSDIFALYPDFVIPRRQRTIVIVHGACNQSSAARIVYTDSTLEQIVDTISSQMHSCDSAAHSSPQGATNEELSTREVQVLQLVVNGTINKEIAQQLGISLNTVLTHRKNITAKLGIKTVSGLTLYALMHGYISG